MSDSWLRFQKLRGGKKVDPEQRTHKFMTLVKNYPFRCSGIVLIVSVRNRIETDEESANFLMERVDHKG